MCCQHVAFRAGAALIYRFEVLFLKDVLRQSFTLICSFDVPLKDKGPETERQREADQQRGKQADFVKQIIVS